MVGIKEYDLKILHDFSWFFLRGRWLRQLRSLAPPSCSTPWTGSRRRFYHVFSLFGVSNKISKSNKIWWSLWWLNRFHRKTGSSLVPGWFHPLVLNRFIYPRCSCNTVIGDELNILRAHLFYIFIDYLRLFAYNGAEITSPAIRY